MLVIIRGAGDIATGIALRLKRAHIQVIMTDIPAPTAIRRTVALSQAIVLGETKVEDVTARRADTAEQALALLKEGAVPVLPDPEGACIPALRPDAVVDAILAKRNLGMWWRPCGATPWGGCTMRAPPCPIPGCPASSAASLGSGCSGPRRTGRSTRFWTSAPR